MKLYLDDYRDPPEGWTVVRTAKEAIRLLSSGTVTDISFDHDLGTKETGYDVISWLEEQVVYGKIKAPRTMQVHSANPVGKQRIMSVIKKIFDYENL
jgi:hypothetical protein